MGTFAIFVCLLLQFSYCILETSSTVTLSESLLQKLEAEDSQVRQNETSNVSPTLHDIVFELPSVIDNILQRSSSQPVSSKTLVKMLKKRVSKTQGQLLKSLTNQGIPKGDITRFWIANKIGVSNVPTSTIRALSNLRLRTSVFMREPSYISVSADDGDRNILQLIDSLKKTTTTTSPVPITNATTLSPTPTQAPTSRPAPTPAPAPTPPTPAPIGEVQWGVAAIGAPKVWPRTKGASIVVGNIDTGVFGDHVALRANYAGKFFDAVNGRTTPYDDNGHGTHVMGTMVGTEKGIGVAPAAKWIACKALNAKGIGTDLAFTKCAQWVLQQKPHIINNSWGGPGGSTSFNEEIKAWQAVGIIPVFSIGNTGPGCGTATSPGDQPNVIGVGATSRTGSVAAFSSRGPSKEGRLIKPDISAPGVDILSAGTDGPTSYKVMQGTSMAAPHVSGAIALMLSLKPSMTYSQILGNINKGATQPPLDNDVSLCGGEKGFPNNALGIGIVNVEKAVVGIS